MDDHFGLGTWRGLRRRGIWQGQIRKDGGKKIRGIDNARSSKHHSAAFMICTIKTTASNIAMQLVLWLARATQTPLELEQSRFVMGLDDLADAYQGIPNCPESCSSIDLLASTCFVSSTESLFGWTSDCSASLLRLFLMLRHCIRMIL